MDRPTIMLALTGETQAYAAAVERAGFEALDDPAVFRERVAAGNLPHVAVLDADLDPEVGASLWQTLHAEKLIPTLLLVDQDLPTWAPIAEGSGTRDEFALKPAPPDSIVYRLQALLLRGGVALPTVGSGAWMAETADTEVTAIGEGRVISVFAPKGGVGKTTVAVNLAVALRQQTRGEVLLLDADAGVGNVTAMFDVPYRMGLADLADSPSELWTDAAFEHATTIHQGTGVRVLTWGVDPAESESVGADLLLAAVRWARARHAWVVVDTHPGYDDRTIAMLTVASEIFLVVTPEVGAVRNSAQFLALARDLGLRDAVRVVVNRANHGIGMKDIADSLGLPISGSIVSDGRKAVLASNEGIPILLKFPKEKISSDLHAVARLLTAPPPATAPARSSTWWAPASTTASAQA